MAEVFLSYAQKDRARVKRLFDALTAEGYEVWWDLQIRAGESFDELIESTLEREGVVTSRVPALEPLSRFRDRLGDGSEGPEMVVIPAGSFWMGSSEAEPDRRASEGPRHTVGIRHPLAVGRTPVTVAEYDHFAESTQREKPPDQRWGRGNRPVIHVSWEDAVAYAQWLYDQTGKRYRLPSEAEWEYAARAGTETPWSFGNAASDLGAFAWYRDNSGGQTHPVGEKEANPWGLHDVQGNVWEWVQDCWHANYEGAPADGSAWGPEAGGDCGRRVLRGGSWHSDRVNLRSAARYRNNADARNTHIGLRLDQDL